MSKARRCLLVERYVWLFMYVARCLAPAVKFWFACYIWESDRKLTYKDPPLSGHRLLHTNRKVRPWSIICKRHLIHSLPQQTSARPLHTTVLGNMPQQKCFNLTFYFSLQYIIALLNKFFYNIQVPGNINNILFLWNIISIQLYYFNKNSIIIIIIIWCDILVKWIKIGELEIISFIDFVQCKILEFRTEQSGFNYQQTDKKTIKVKHFYYDQVKIVSLITGNAVWGLLLDEGRVSIYLIYTPYLLILVCVDGRCPVFVWTCGDYESLANIIKP